MWREAGDFFADFFILRSADSQSLRVIRTDNVKGEGRKKSKTNESRKSRTTIMITKKIVTYPTQRGTKKLIRGLVHSTVT
jgi:hypothetical protein